MGLRDAELAERKIIDRADSFIQDDAITSSELQDGAAGIGTDDIADASLTSAKLHTGCRDATKGLTGLGGATALTLVPDGTLLELDAGVTPAKKVRIKDDGVGITQIEALSAGGLTGGAGSAWDVNPDGVGLELNASKLRVKDLGVTIDKLQAYSAGGLTGGAGSALAVNPDANGLEISGGKLALKDASVLNASLAIAAKLRRFTAPLTVFISPGTVIDPIMVCPAGKRYTITKVAACSHVLCTDANGTLTCNLIKYDSSGTADVQVCTDEDAEFTAAKVAEDWTVITAASANVMDEHDSLRLETLGLDEGADGLTQSPVDSILTIEYWETTLP